MSNTPSLADAESACAAYGHDPARCGFELCRDVVLAVRESKLSRPDLVVKYGQYLLKSHASRLGPEVWALYEQVYVVLLQYGRRRKKAGSKGAAADESAAADALRLAGEYCTLISARFPDSVRVRRLEAMMWEAKDEFELAMADYDEILKDDPTNLFALKRQVALLRSHGKSAEAVKKLASHLEEVVAVDAGSDSRHFRMAGRVGMASRVGPFVVGSDADSWLQLCDLYLSAQQYRRAAFCMEELILINPMSFLFHVRYAEILLTLGGVEKGANAELVRTARKYFAHSLDLKPSGNLRALYGLLVCCAAAPKGVKSQTEVEELGKFAQGRLLEEYGAAKSTAMLDLARAMSSTLLA